MPERKRIEFEVPVGGREVGCTSCRAPIVWIETPLGKRMPLSMRTVRTAEDGTRWAESHFADCPNAGKHRRKP